MFHLPQRCRVHEPRLPIDHPHANPREFRNVWKSEFAVESRIDVQILYPSQLAIPGKARKRCQGSRGHLSSCESPIQETRATSTAALAPTNEKPHIQEGHILIGRLICEIGERELFDEKGGISGS